MYKDPIKQREFQKLWRRKAIIRWKMKAIELLGGECNRCGYNKHPAALEIDHIIPVLRELDTKRFRAGSSATQAVATGRIPTSEVQLLCANCHSIKTYEEDRKLFKNYQGDGNAWSVRLPCKQ